MDNIKEFEISLGAGDKITVKGISAEMDLLGNLIISGSDGVVFIATMGRWNYYLVK